MASSGGRAMSACARDRKVGGRRKASRQRARLRCVDGRRRSAKTTEIDGGGVLARCWAMRGRVRECRWRIARVLARTAALSPAHVCVCTQTALRSDNHCKT